MEKRFEPLPEPLSEPEPGVPAPKPPEAPIGAEQIRFVLKYLVLEGVTVYRPEELLPLYEEFLNREILVSDVVIIAERVTAKYRNDGYLLSQAIIPPQTIKDGVVRIQVIEGAIDDVKIEGTLKDSTKRLQRYARKIVASRPLRSRDLERYLLLAGDLAGVDVTAVLEPSATEPGMSTMTLVVEEKRIDGFASVDNRGSKFVGPWQFQAGTSINSIFDRNDQTRIRVAVAPEIKELRYGEITHEEPVGGEGTTIQGVIRGTLSEPGDTLKELEIETRSFSINLLVRHPFIRSRPKNLSGRLLLHYRDSSTDILQAPFTEDRIRAIRGGLTYDFVDKHRGINLVDLEVSQGLDILDATETGSPNLSRANARSNFLKSPGSHLAFRGCGETPACIFKEWGSTAPMHCR